MHQIISNAMYLNNEKPLAPERTRIDLSEEFINHLIYVVILMNKYKSRKTFIQELPLFKTEINNFQELTHEEVKEMVFKSPNKFCKLDHMPTWMIRDCIEEVLLLITKIINLSLRLGEMRDELKIAIINPLLKKLGLDLVKQYLKL